MPDERQDSIRHGIAAPPESTIGQAAARENAQKLPQGPPIEGGLGGTSDAETAPEESQMNRLIRPDPDARP